MLPHVVARENGIDKAVAIEHRLLQRDVEASYKVRQNHARQIVGYRRKFPPVEGHSADVLSRARAGPQGSVRSHRSRPGTAEESRHTFTGVSRSRGVDRHRGLLVRRGDYSNSTTATTAPTFSFEGAFLRTVARVIDEPCETEPPRQRILATLRQEGYDRTPQPARGRPYSRMVPRILNIAKPCRALETRRSRSRCYSATSAICGSTREARSAGSQLANTVVTSSVNVTIEKTTGSRADS
jgi:hypothetical protein